MVRPPPRSTLFPYTSLLRSLRVTADERRGQARQRGAAGSRSKRTVRGDRLPEPAQLQRAGFVDLDRSEEHTSGLQSRHYLVCRLPLAKKEAAHTVVAVASI